MTETLVMLVFRAGQGTCSFVLWVSKKKVGFLAQKDDNADDLVSLCSSLLQNKNKERDGSVGGQGSQSLLPNPKSPPFSSCV